MRKQIRIIVIFTAVLAIAFAAYYKYGRKTDETNIVFSEHLDETVFSVDERNITLKEASYYILSVENFYNKEALNYNDLDPLEYWNTHFRAGDDSAFVSTIAKNEAYELCIRDFVYCAEAAATGFGLTDEQKEEALEAADIEFAEFTDKQLESTVFTLSEYEAMKLVEKTAKAYAELLARETDWSYTVISASTQLSYGGDYFQNNILVRHEVTTNTDLWKKIQLGKITIN